MNTAELTQAELIELVQESHQGYIDPGTKPSGRAIFFVNSNERTPKRDIITYWRLLYVACNTEYEFAMKAVGDWALYNKVKGSCRVYRDTFLKEWNEERELRLLSESYTKVIKSIKEGDTKSAQWLITHRTKFQGKPTKQEKKAMITKIDGVLDSVESNYDQLN